MKYSLGISNFLEAIPSLSHSVVGIGHTSARDHSRLEQSVLRGHSFDFENGFPSEIFSFGAE